MKLARPLAVLDLETTGPSITTDRIVDISIVTRLPNGGLERWSSLVNPGAPIPPSASRVHGITDEMVAGAPAFADIAIEVLNRLDGCDIGGFNVRAFDLPLLRAELARAGMSLGDEHHVVDAMTIFHAFERRDLSSAVRLYLGRSHDGAHRAEADAFATLQVLEAQVQTYPIPDNVPGLAAFRPPGAIDAEGKLVWIDSERGPLPCFSFGKHKGHSLQWLRKNEPDFLRWVLRADFSDEVKTIVREALEGRFPSKETKHADSRAA